MATFDPISISCGRNLANQVFVEPDCSLQCPDPDPVPPGYVKLDCGWTCANGWGLTNMGIMGHTTTHTHELFTEIK